MKKGSVQLVRRGHNGGVVERRAIQRRELTTAEGSKRVDLPQGLVKVVHRPRNGRRRANQNQVLRDTDQETVRERVAHLKQGSTMTV